MRRFSLLQLRCSAFVALSACEPTLDVGSWVVGTDVPTVPIPTNVTVRDASATDATAGMGGSSSLDASVGGNAPVDASAGGVNVVDANTSDSDAAADAATVPSCDPLAFMGRNDAGEPLAWTTSIDEPWGTGFEDALCEFSTVTGYCYSSTAASYEVVTEPVRTGRFSMAFTINTDDAVDGTQARCVRQGVLPSAAYYSVWYYIPAFADNTSNWNLFFFQGSDTAEGAVWRGLWDVSMSDRDGQLHLFVRNFIGGQTHDLPASPPIPIGSWFHLEMYLRRAADATGEMALYQDGQLLLQLQNVVTDDTQWGQWYFGNLGDALNPATSTLYVDDVTISETR